MQAFGFGLQTPSGPFGSDITRLANTLGTSSTLGIYDGRFGITLNVSNVSSWAASFGSLGAMTGAGTQQPAYANGVLTFNGTTNTLSTQVASASLNMSTPLSLIMVGSIPAGAGNGNGAVAINDSSSLTNGMAIIPLAGTGTNYNGELFQIGSGFPAATLVALGATTRVIIQTCNGTTGGTIRVPNQSSVAETAGTSMTSSSCFLIAGSLWQPTAISPCNCFLQAIIILNRVVTGGDVTTITNWATSYHQAVAA